MDMNERGSQCAAYYSLDGRTSRELTGAARTASTPRTHPPALNPTTQDLTLTSTPHDPDILLCTRLEYFLWNTGGMACSNFEFGTRFACVRIETSIVQTPPQAPQGFPLCRIITKKYPIPKYRHRPWVTANWRGSLCAYVVKEKKRYTYFTFVKYLPCICGILSLQEARKTSSLYMNFDTKRWISCISQRFMKLSMNVSNPLQML